MLDIRLIEDQLGKLQGLSNPGLDLVLGQGMATVDTSLPELGWDRLGLRFDNKPSSPK